MPTPQATVEEIRIWFSMSRSEFYNMEEVYNPETGLPMPGDDLSDHQEPTAKERAEQLLKMAYTVIVQRLGSAALFNEYCASLQLQMVTRVWNNPNSMSQHGFGQENTTFANGGYGISLSPLEGEELDKVKAKRGFITVTTVRNDLAAYSAPGRGWTYL